LAILNRLTNILRRHWAERKDYPSKRDWMMSIYNRVLVHAPHVPLPARGRVRRVRPKGERQPVLVRLGSSDWYCLEEVFLQGEYAEVVKHLARDGAASVKTVVDLGANVGMSVRFWRHAFPGVRVVAVEPDSANIAMAVRNVAEASDGQTAPADVTFIEACVAARPGSVYLDRSGGEYAFRMSDHGQGATVPAITVPQVLERAALQGRVDLLKCDIEGAEAEVFADCSAWIGRVNHLAIEIHAPYTLEKLMTDLTACRARPRVVNEVSKGDLAVALISFTPP
jgi:FkbM family methyltransferase